MHGDEVAYYRAVEDHFARLRGTVFLFSPKDFALLRRWWTEGVPLAAVIAGIGEATARKAERDEDPVSSLAYCRFAIARHAKRLLAAGAGGASESAAVDVPARLGAYVAAVREAAERWHADPEVAAALGALAEAVLTLPTDAPVAALEATAASLEASALDAVGRALPTAARLAVEAAVTGCEDAAGGSGQLTMTARLAIRVRAVRDALSLPRLGLVGDAGQD
jgi:hypothetical protein